MEKYEKPQLDVEYFMVDVIMTSDTNNPPPVGCGKEDDELPLQPGSEYGDF